MLLCRGISIVFVPSWWNYTEKQKIKYPGALCYITASFEPMNVLEMIYRTASFEPMNVLEMICVETDRHNVNLC